ncbi:MAG: hypothetical protein ACK40K_01130 [Raineya sp.]
MSAKALHIFFVFFLNFGINTSENTEKISFTLKNDLALNVTLSTETSDIILQSGAAYRLERNLGEKIYLVKKNEPKKLLFVVKETHKNKTLRISQFF